MTAVLVKNASNVEGAPTTSIAFTAGIKSKLAEWLPFTTIALGVALTFLWTASLVGLSVWAVLLLV
jgi:hypothetical protein